MTYQRQVNIKPGIDATLSPDSQNDGNSVGNKTIERNYENTRIHNYETQAHSEVDEKKLQQPTSRKEKGDMAEDREQTQTVSTAQATVTGDNSNISEEEESSREQLGAVEKEMNSLYSFWSAS
ncbi:hypothetical protein PoB_003173500 [Plakobranchus ocellatus]|uniref:Uncharacterized protein n=1 Tax=Plakobranchus ocellatus TaxID=259542 RepID=A0AAV4AAM9_9GAST|nr:hypothetical protein PoB_003173500 [Plakobranchus ocellatus]